MGFTGFGGARGRHMTSLDPRSIPTRSRTRSPALVRVSFSHTQTQLAHRYMRLEGGDGTAPPQRGARGCTAAPMPVPFTVNGVARPATNWSRRLWSACSRTMAATSFRLLLNPRRTTRAGDRTQTRSAAANTCSCSAGRTRNILSCSSSRWTAGSRTARRRGCPVLLVQATHAGRPHRRRGRVRLRLQYAFTPARRGVALDLWPSLSACRSRRGEPLPGGRGLPRRHQPRRDHRPHLRRPDAGARFTRLGRVGARTHPASSGTSRPRAPSSSSAAWTRGRVAAALGGLTVTAIAASCWWTADVVAGHRYSYRLRLTGRFWPAR